MNRHHDYCFDTALLQRLITVTVTTASLLVGVFTSTHALAQIRSDPSAPRNQRPTVLLAPNGVPVVNIQTPSAAGVSRNTYSQFDVKRNGTILNNSRTDASTQLGGWVQANPWLATGSARVILNEINSSNPSYLNGWVEVAGSRAQVVIANPAGISCNGCGFINASKTTLATGTPIVKSGSLESYHIPAGELRIEGLGLDARQTDALTILTRSAEVNAAIWAQRLKVITGKNDVSVDANGEVTTIAPVIPPPLIITPIPGSYPGRSTGSPPPAFALDTAYLGGMYAGHIFIIGTEDGLGTRHLGTFKASQELTLSTNGWLDVKGSISAPKLTVESEQLSNRGLITGQTVSIASPDIKNVGTGRMYGDQLALQADTIVNAPETVNGITTAPVIAARDHLVIGTGTLENRDGGLIISAGDAVIGRRVEAAVDTVAGGPTLTATGFATTITNDSATIDIQGNAQINATTINNINSQLTTAQVDEAPFHTQRLLVARTNAMYPASQCRGLHGDGKKLGGTRIDLDLLCGADNKRCTTNPDGSLKINAYGLIEFKPETTNVNSLEEFLLTPDGVKMAGVTGGIQGAKGTLFGVPYQAGSWQDQLVEAFAGTHDMVGGKLSGLYDEKGNIRREMSNTTRKVYDYVVTPTALVPSAPFAAAELLSPEMWNAISILLKEAR